MHAPLCGIFAPNSGYVARYAPFIIPAICMPTLHYICPECRLHSPLRRSLSGTNRPQSVTHSCQKAIFKHALEQS
ncbi:MAG: hypothetical protein E7B11_13015 [Clostridiales bacterium]|nr:hypothetical protein [Clostridiales bacterium]